MLERIQEMESNHAAASKGSLNSIDSEGSTNDPASDIFEEALKTAEKVVLYFHGQVGTMTNICCSDAS